MCNGKVSDLVTYSNDKTWSTAPSLRKLIDLPQVRNNRTDLRVQSFCDSIHALLLIFEWHNNKHETATKCSHT